MKKPVFLGLAIAAIALSSFSVSVVADSKYPAADFEPSVIYLSKDANTASSSQDESADPKYPAANFTPIVVYASAETTAAPDPVDPKYPAAYYTPKVIYP
ncbi:MAG: hypothetical protein NTV43_08480 [Methylococcales bacterium]|nr:hypothetical protein [Methylococcales bacterium]